MKYLLIILCLIVFPIAGHCEYNNTKVRLYLKTKLGEEFNALVFGIDKDATDYLDKNLGEQELFPGHPPSGLHAVFVIYDSVQKENVWSYLDLKSFPQLDTGYKYYRLDVQYHVGDNLIFEWRPFGDEIREAWITDIITGNVVKINMKDSTSAFIENQFIKKFDIKVKYESGTSADEYQDAENSIYPSLIKDKFHIANTQEIYNLTIYNSFGEEILREIISNNKATVNISFLPAGMYFVKLNLLNNKTIIKKILKI